MATMDHEKRNRRERTHLAGGEPAWSGGFSDRATIADIRQMSRLELVAYQDRREKINRMNNQWRHNAEQWKRHTEIRNQKRRHRQMEKLRARLLEDHRSPVQAEKARQAQAALAGKRKSHLQAWIETLPELKRNRSDLKREWRKQLLNNG